MGRLVHFEIHASRPQALIEFYSELLGWTFSRWGEIDYWVITTGPKDTPGIDGGLLPRQGDRPEEMAAVNAFVCTAEVDSVDQAVTRAVERGGSVALPKNPVPGIGWLAYVKDPDGNIVGLLEPDENAPAPEVP
ncbi:MAG TPA: VOC family protein [Thermoleophilia bacterium]|nr:VOC family protein [Thermoleophilia bacterium]